MQITLTFSHTHLQNQIPDKNILFKVRFCTLILMITLFTLGLHLGLTLTTLTSTVGWKKNLSYFIFFNCQV